MVLLATGLVDVFNANARLSFAKKTLIWFLEPSILGLALYAAVAMAVCNGCTSTAETRARTALEVIGQAGDGAYELAQQQCQREQLAYAAIGAQSSVETSIARCDTIYDVFERIAALHDSAATLLERGELEKAQDMLAQVSMMWAELRGGT